MSLSVVNRHFVRHYVEMLVAMMLGMVVLGLPAAGVLAAAGSSFAVLAEDAPAVVLALMGLSMTVPMVAFMRWRGHGWRPCWEMSAAMVVPTLLAIALLAASVGSFDTLMAAEHVVMPVAMFAVMLARPGEYACPSPPRPA